MRRLRLLVASALVSTACSSGDQGTSTTGTFPTTGASAGVTTTDDPDPSGPGSRSTTDDPDPSTTGGDPSEGEDEGESSSGPTPDVGSVDPTTGDPGGMVVMETSLGTLTIELYPDRAPITVDNFLAYVAAGFYDGTDGQGQTIFHRVIPGFVIQGGGLTDGLDDKSTMAPITNEHRSSGLTNDRGTLSMARTSDPDSATSQFFVNLVDNPGLDESPGYAVFARVVEGMDVVDAIAAVPTTDVPPYTDVPVDPVYITSVSLE